MLLENRQWDLIIFDEAHQLSAKEYGRKDRQDAELSTGGSPAGLHGRFAAADGTPHAGDPNHSRFMNLVRCLEPKVDFSPLMDQPLFPRRRGALFQVDSAHAEAAGDGRRREGGFQGTHERSTCPSPCIPTRRSFTPPSRTTSARATTRLKKSKTPCTSAPMGFILTTFQKLNASSFQAIKAALEGRLARLGKKLEDFRPGRGGRGRDERFQGELEEKDAVLKTDREILKDEIKTLTKLWPSR